MNVTLVWRTDVHLSDRSPQSRVDDWTETLLGKIQQVGKIAQDVGAEAVLDGGDFFHVKSPTRNSHRLVNQAAAAHAEYPCPVYACIGNHDVKYGDYAYLGEQPLGVLFESGVFRRLYDEHESLFGQTEAGSPLVRVVGVPYHGTEYDFERLSKIKKQDEKYLVVVAHLLASPSGGTMFEAEDIVKYGDLAGLDPDLWLFGHWHKDQGVKEIAPGKYVVNIGSLSRGALNQDDVSRKPSVAVLRFDPDKGMDIEVRPLAVAPPGEVFDMDRRVRSESKALSMTAFVDSIQGILEESQGDAIEARIRGLEGIPDEVREQALLYWEQAQ